MKFYMGGGIEPHEYGFVSACFANSADEAKELMWKESDQLRDECDGEWIQAKITRDKMHDELLDTERVRPYVVRDSGTLRRMYWRIEGDGICCNCGFAELGGEYPICQECQTCEDCNCGECEMCEDCE